MPYKKSEERRLFSAAKDWQRRVAIAAVDYINGVRTRDELEGAVKAYQDAMSALLAYACRQEK